jgi:hypothetical protein
LLLSDKKVLSVSRKFVKRMYNYSFVNFKIAKEK